jgi:tetratricopeptide (TPR) repeat protein
MRKPIFFLSVSMNVAAIGFAQTAAPPAPSQLPAIPAAPMSVDSATYWLWHAAADANQIADPTEKAGVLTSIAEQFLGIGDMRSAQAVAAAATDAAKQIADAQACFRAFMALASFHEHAQDGQASANISAAATTVNAMAPGAGRDEASRQIADMLGIVSGFNAAAVSMKSVTDPVERATRFTDMAAAFAAAGPAKHQDYLSAIAAADAAANQIADPTLSQMTRAMIVKMRVEVGDIDAAAAMANALSYPAAEGEAYAYLAQGYIQTGRRDQALRAISEMLTAAGGSSEERRAAIWLDIAHARQNLGDKAGAMQAVNTAVTSALRLEPADQADALAAASGMKVDLGDTAGAAVLAGDAAKAAGSIPDPSDATEVYMSVAAAQARCGLSDLARQSIEAARLAASRIPGDRQHPGGDPPKEAYFPIIQAAADAGDFTTAERIAKEVNDPHLNHDAALAIAGAEIDLGQYQAAEDAAAHEGSPDSEAAVCGMIAASLARTRTATDADAWVKRLPNTSDRIAAELAVAQFEESKRLPPTPGR